MRLLIVCGSIVLAGCSSSSDELSTDDAYRVYVAPAVCMKFQQCTPGPFAMAFSSLEDCQKKVIEKANVSNQLSGCTNAQYKTCTHDYNLAACHFTEKDPTPNPKETASCAGCAF